MDLKQLQYFVACAQAGSFSDAAKILYSTQPSVSKVIKALEDTLGMQLFERQILREYAQYVAKVREYARETELDVAVEQAVNDCIQNNILTEFLRKNKSEVIAMSIFEYDKEEEEKKLRKAEFEAGVEAGFKTGIETGIKSMLDLGKYSMEEIAEVFHVSVDKVKAVRNMLI